MSTFDTQVQLATQAFEKGNYETVIATLEIAYSMLDKTMSITKDLIYKSVDIIEPILQFSEINESTFISKTIQDLKLRLQIGESQYVDVTCDEIQHFHLLLKGLERGCEILNDKGIKLGQEESNLSFGITGDENKGISLDIFAKISEQEQGLSKRQAEDLHSALENMLSSNSELSKMLNIAAQLSSSGRYEESNMALEKILARYPEDAATCLNMMGANFFFLQDYPKAIDFYLKALKQGESKEMIEFNVWEACVELMKQATDETQRNHWRTLYRQHFPQGERSL